MRIPVAVLLTGLPGLAMAASGPDCAVSATSLGRAASAHPLALPAYPTPVMPTANRPVLAAPGKTPPRTKPASLPQANPNQPARAADPPLVPSVAALAAAQAAVTLASAPASAPASASASAPTPAPRTPATPGAPVLRSVRDLPMPAGVKRIPAAEITAVPALRQIASHGAALYDIGTIDGMRGVFAKNGSLFSVFYITPDGRSEIQGEMWSDHGKNITLRQVAAIPGVLPTVTIGKIGKHQPVAHAFVHTTGPSPAAAVAPATTVIPPSNPPAPSPIAPLPVPVSPAQKAREVASVFRMLRSTDHGTVGLAGAPHLWMLIDPMCIHSIHAMQALAPFVNAGKLRLSVIPLSILDYEDKGESTVKAQVMASRAPATMVADWIDKGLPETASAGAAGKLARNMAVARYIGLTGTPTLLWHARDGLIGRSNGNPGDVATIIASIQPPS
ncbi:MULTISPECIES: hypothetical protein [Acidiphilium]|uniref:Thiol:disulfide interchange protein DsbG n=1 Tax=Acidiphilium rubrum TaxID=526 RepID=A0A8G2FHP2_ACIRU|nr:MULTISPECIES: hypothetical protein [Acidiphilium]SIR30103.1 thiol:disulfide interchange protein DsbG [Acidiphilium rubrum]